MNKTGSEIEQDIFDMIKLSEIASFVKGEVYKTGMRPVNSRKEDITVSFLSGLDGQFQDGTINVNVFITDLIKDGHRVPDSARIKVAESKAMRTYKDLVSSDYLFYLTDIIKTFEAENEQHFINVKLKFRRIS